MQLTIEQHTQVYKVLAAEEAKARKAVAKALAAADKAPSGFGGVSVERTTATVLLNLRTAQYQAARIASTEYFNAYIKESA